MSCVCACVPLLTWLGLSFDVFSSVAIAPNYVRLLM